MLVLQCSCDFVISKLKMAEYKFVKELPDDYLCMICAKVLNEPHLTDCCGQHFCQACLEQWFRKQAKKICPHCRSESFTHMRYLPLKRKIDDLKVYCPNRAEGCKVITKAGELNSHKNECGFAKVICTQLCGKLILRKDLTQHCNSECSKRKILCKYCGTVDHYEAINGKHMTVCEEHPVNCPRGCTQPEQIKRKDLAKHAEICPLEIVLCPFNEAGCGTRVLRKDLCAHMEVNTQQHLMKMMTAYSKLKIEHAKLHDNYNKLSSQVAGLTFIEPVKLTGVNDSFSFIITSSRGWTSPPFCVLDGYTFCIKHKEGRVVCLMLLKGNNDDNLKWPMNLQHKLKMIFEKQRRTPAPMILSIRQSAHDHAPREAFEFPLSSNIERVAIGDYGREVASATLSVSLNYKVIVKLIPIIIASQLMPIGDINAPQEAPPIIRDLNVPQVMPIGDVDAPLVIPDLVDDNVPLHIPSKENFSFGNFQSTEDVPKWP